MFERPIEKRRPGALLKRACLERTTEHEASQAAAAVTPADSEVCGRAVRGRTVRGSSSRWIDGGRPLHVGQQTKPARCGRRFDLRASAPARAFRGHDEAHRLAGRDRLQAHAGVHRRSAQRPHRRHRVAGARDSRRGDVRVLRVCADSATARRAAQRAALRIVQARAVGRPARSIPAPPFTSRCRCPSQRHLCDLYVTPVLLAALLAPPSLRRSPLRRQMIRRSNGPDAKPSRTGRSRRHHRPNEQGGTRGARALGLPTVDGGVPRDCRAGRACGWSPPTITALWSWAPVRWRAHASSVSGEANSAGGIAAPRLPAEPGQPSPRWWRPDWRVLRAKAIRTTYVRRDSSANPRCFVFDVRPTPQRQGRLRRPDLDRGIAYNLVPLQRRKPRLGKDVVRPLKRTLSFHMDGSACECGARRVGAVVRVLGETVSEQRILVQVCLQVVLSLEAASPVQEPDTDRDTRLRTPTGVAR